MKKEESVGYKLRLLHNQIHKRMEYRKTKNEFAIGNLTRMQRLTMGYLYENRNREIYQKDMEAAFAISRATASNMLSVMERKGLIKRESVVHDARLKKLSLTERAEQMHIQVEEDIEKMEELLTKGMNAEEKQRLQGYLNRMLANLSEQDETGE